MPTPVSRRAVVAGLAGAAALVAEPLLLGEICGLGVAAARKGGDDGGEGNSGRGGGDDGDRGSGRDRDRDDEDDRDDDRPETRDRSRRADRDRRVTAEVRGDTVEVAYPDGWHESLKRGRLRLRDPDGRLVVDRPATAEDRRRIRAYLR